MNLDQLKYFNVVAKTHSMTAAADALFISQSALSLAIQSLERELGFYLFVRTNHGVELTDFGRSIYEETQKVDTILADIQQKVLEENKRSPSRSPPSLPSPIRCCSPLCSPFTKFIPKSRCRSQKTPCQPTWSMSPSTITASSSRPPHSMTARSIISPASPKRKG